MVYWSRRYWAARYWGRFWGQLQTAVALVLKWLSGPTLVLTRLPVDDKLYIDGPHVVKWQAEKYSISDDTLGPASSLTLTGRISLTPTGSAVGSCSVSLTEVGSLGVYSGTIAASTLTSALAAYLGQRVWEIVEDSNGNGRKSKELIVAYRSVEVEGQ